jgi:hypothetical protein
MIFEHGGKFGHWCVSWDFDPVDFVGFVYKITHIPTGRAYIGKKFFWLTTRKILKTRKNRKKIIKESNWKEYTGSSKWLNSDIELFGKKQFKFEILSLHECRSTLAWEEIRLLVINDALRAKFSDGTKKFYNGMINGIKYTINDESEKEKRFKV